MSTDQPRRHGRPALYVMGGQTGSPEDFPSEGQPADLETGNPPVWAATVDEVTTLTPELAAAVRESSDAVAAAVAWDQAAAAEPYQVDVTRSMEDTTRIGNSLSKALRLELLTTNMREELLDRPGPGWPADEEDAVFRDPVDGAELDPVDGLPVHELEDCDSGHHIPMVNGTCALCGDELEADRPPVTDVLDEDGTMPWRPDIRPTDLVAIPDRLAFAAPRPVEAAPVRVLNWQSHHDVKSLDYLVRDRLRAPAPLVTRIWEHGPILDQGTTPPLSLHDASGCTGHAGINAVNVLTLAAHRGAADLVAPLDHGDAMKLYGRAQELDDVPGAEYPGTSILAVMKAGQELGYWGSYLWAKGTRDIAQAILQVGPVVIGIPWLSGMTEPGPDGVVTVSGDKMGGHALCLHAIAMKIGERAGPWFGALQTYGETVGDHGVIWFHHKDLAALLHGVGEAAIPIPRDELPR